MKSSGRAAALLVVTENIEMERFSSEETCEVLTTEEKQEESSFQKEHPLIPESSEGSESQVRTKSRQQARPNPNCPVQEAPELCSGGSSKMSTEEKVEIEMRILSPIKVPNSELVEIKSSDSCILIPLPSNKSSRLKWKPRTPQKTKLVVRDVICLPRGHSLSQLERQVPPRREKKTVLSARITIDCCWSASQMGSRLEMLFWECFRKQAGQRFSFTYLQCVQGSRALFVPDTPAEGWTGEQVLRISAHGALYILSHHDYAQTEEHSQCNEDVDALLQAPHQAEGGKEKTLKPVQSGERETPSKLLHSTSP